MEITKEVFENFVVCPYKAYLTSKNESGHKTEHEIISRNVNGLYCIKALKRHFPKQNAISEFPIDDFSLKDGHKILPRASVNSQDLFSCCTVERIPKYSDLGSFSYIPIRFTPKENLSKEDKLAMAFDGFILGNMQSRFPSHGKIVHGKNFKIKRVEIESYFPRVKGIISEIRKFSSTKEAPPKIILNRHCQICEFRNSCRAIAVEKDDLSLLSGVSAKEIADQNKKGIFTVTQYSYTFRPRRKFRKSYPHNLKALAIREKRIHIYGKPEVPTTSVRIYFDVEGDPERDFYYLVGAVIHEGGMEKRLSFWADDEEKEKEIFLQFFQSFAKYPEFTLYHYGSYEIKFIRKAQKSLGQDYVELADKILKNSINVLSIVYMNIFFPTFSNGLKDIGAYLGFQWSSEDASGIQSLVWRKQFELSSGQTVKDKLIKYNMDDCYALKRVTEFIHSIERNSGTNKDVISVEDLKEESTYKWGKVDFLISDLEYVNNCAYFDYQREKVFVRTHKNLKNVKKNGRFQEKRCYRINKKIISPIQRKCPYCGGKLYRNGQDYARKVYDLKISDVGIKRWVTSYQATTGRCFPCHKVITFERVKGIKKYGHGLMGWVVYQNIAGHQPFYQIQDMLDDLYGLSVSGTVLQKFKSIAAKFYLSTYQEIINRMRQGNLIHADETQVTFQEANGYVWVLANMEEVYFFYTPTREGDFLKELLSNFKGVLISDFYGVYSSPSWIQQKCLIHLIRDINDDLRQNPFNQEYKQMAGDFSILLRNIITTVDKHGLKRRNLNKHKKDVAQFYHKILSCGYQTELAQKYQKRFEKNRDYLFTFLNYDGIPWNNNNAEHAIKHFAKFRRIMKMGGNFTEKGLREYLILLSIYQTCRYKGINFMKFLASGEKKINEFKG